MQSYEEKLELEVFIPRKLYDEWELTIKINIKDYECHALCDLGASCSDQISNGPISVLRSHPWISNADTAQYLKDL